MRHYEGKSTERHEIRRSDSGIATVQTLQHQDGGHLRRVVSAVREIPWAEASAGDGEGGGGGVFDAPGGEQEGGRADAEPGAQRAGVPVSGGIEYAVRGGGCDAGTGDEAIAGRAVGG